MRRYLDYKDSGIYWIGNVPMHWHISKFKHAINIINGYPFKSDLFDPVEGFPLIRIRDITSGEISIFYKGDFDKDFIVNNADLLVGMDGDFNIRWWESGDALLNQRCCKVMNKNISHLRYIYYLLPIYLKIINDLTYFTTVKHLSNEDIIKQSVALPSLNEQNSIATFLDHKTQLIDDLIAKKERLIDLMTEERTAMINQAVTKGLDPNVPMKDSGIEWLGEIPEHWEVKRLRYIGTSQNGVSAGSEYFGSGYPFVSYSDVYNNESLPDTVSGLAQSSENDRKNFSVLEGDVFFTRTSETVDEIGIASTCIHTIENAVFAGFLIRVRPNKKLLYKSFSKYYFRCFVPRVFFVKEMNLVTRASLSQELLKRLPIFLPPIEEQNEIAIHLDTQVANIDSSRDNLINGIRLLNEYKTSLINEVVTGKIDVSEYNIE